MKIVASVRTSPTGYYNDLLPIQFNADSTSLYSRTIIYGLGSAGNGSFNNTNTTTVGAGVVPTSIGTANTFSNLEIYIPNYTGSNFKQIIVDSTAEDNSTNNAYLYLGSGLYRSTSAITKISISLSFVQYSTISLYGVLRQGI